jgi:hypothetical protein
VFFYFRHNASTFVGAKLSKNIQQQQSDDAERNKPDKHHNDLQSNFARDADRTMLKPAQKRGKATLIAYQRFADGRAKSTDPLRPRILGGAGAYLLVKEFSRPAD